MALNFFLKRSGTASKRPDAVNMAFGEIDLNYSANAGGLFYRDNSNSVVKVGPAEVGASAPNSTPAGSSGNSVGEFWYDTGESVLKIWDGSAWVNTVSTTAFLPLAGGTMTGDITFSGSGIGIVFDDASTVRAISDSTSLSSSVIAASSTAVKSAYDLADAALPKTGGTMTGVITFDPAQTFPTSSIQDGTLTQKGVVQLEDSTSSTSTTLAATPNSVKMAWDLADAAMPRAGGTFSGDIYLYSQVPMDGSMPASKYYADQIAMGYRWQTAVAAATTAAFSGVVTYNNGTAGVGATLTLSTPITTVDGVNIASAGTRVLVKNQSSQLQNGIYTWTSGGATTVLTRATDSDEVSELLSGNAYYVNGGTVNGKQTFVQIPTISAIGTSAITYSLSSVLPFHKYSNEWNVDPVAGDDSNGTGSAEQPYKTIAKALTMAGNGGARVILHQGTYTETVTVTNLNLDIQGANRSGASIQGVVTFNQASSSVRVYGVQFLNNVVHTGNGGLYIQSSTHSGGTSITKSGNGYLEIDDMSADNATLSVTGAGYVNLFNSRIGLSTVNNASAVVTLQDMSQAGAVTVTLGTFLVNASNVFSSTEAGNAITASASSAVYVRNTNFYTPTGATARVSLSGNYSFNDVVVDRANSTLSTNLGSVARFDSIDTFGPILLNGTAGTAGEVLTSGGAGAPPTWTTSAAGTVTSVTAGTGLTGGTITSSGTISLDSACVINPSLLADQGYLISATAASTPVGIAPGTNGQYLAVDPEAPAGLTWRTPSCGTVTSIIAGTGLSGGTITGSGTIALNSATPTAIGGVKGRTDATNAFLGCNTGGAVLGTCNTFLGSEAACTMASGSCVVAIGAGVQPLDPNAGCQLAIGAGTICWLTGTASGAIKPMQGIIDCNNACGTAGQVLSSNGANGVCWATPTAANATPTSFGSVLGRTNATNAALGCNALLSNTTGTVNTAVGLNAGCSNTSGSGNVFVGQNAGINVNGPYNTIVGAIAVCGAGATPDTTTAIGAGAFRAATGAGGSFSLAVGANAGCSLTTGCWNTFVGPWAGRNVTTGNCNVAIGANAAVSNPLGDCQLAIGYANTCNWLTGTSSKAIKPGAGIIDCANSCGTAGQVLMSNGANAICWGSVAGGSQATPTTRGTVYGCMDDTAGNRNTFLGENSGLASTVNAFGNTALGFDAMRCDICGTANVAVGLCSLREGTEGVSNVAIGDCALRSLTIGDRNTAVGSNALVGITTGRRNVALGFNAGCTTTTGSCNVLIGNSVCLASPSDSCQLVIGYSALCSWLTGDSSKHIRPGAGIRDCAGNLGTSGQVLTSTGSALQWSSASGVSCSMVRSNTQNTITPGVAFTPVTICYNNTINDTTGWYNGATGVFQPNIAGFYQINASARIFTGSAAESMLMLTCNGTSIAQNGSFGAVHGSLSTLVRMNGTTDAICVQMFSVSTSCTVTWTFANRFSAALLQPV